MAIRIEIIKGQNIELTPAIEKYVRSRVEKLNKLVDHNDDSIFADVEVGKEVPDQNTGDIFYAKMTLHIAGNYLYAVEKKDDLYAAIDMMEEGMKKELRRKKEKRDTLIKKGARKVKEAITRFRT